MLNDVGMPSSDSVKQCSHILTPWPYFRPHRDRKVHAMRTSRLFSILAISAGLIGGTTLVSPAFAQTGTPAVSYTQSDLTKAQVGVILMAAGYGNIDRIERERDAFEVRTSDKNGARVKLHVDPQTGDILKTDRKERSRDRRADNVAPAR